MLRRALWFAAAAVLSVVLSGCHGLGGRAARDPGDRWTAGGPPASIAAKPLYRDPVFDGAADPVVIWNPHVQRWWMFYTNRRANVPRLSGVAWVHGTPIGIAESADGGVTWSRLGDAKIDVPSAVASAQPTFWAPDVITAPDGTHHMYLTIVPGVFENWQHPRVIAHLTSHDLRTWRYRSTLSLASDRVIDACVFPLPDGRWRMWYNNERDGKSIYFADSADLRTWQDRGKVTSINARGEGPYVFRWKGRAWMLVDTWKGLGVYRSDDLDTWSQQPSLLLDRPGNGADDGVNGGHAGVVVNGDRAYCFYFTHPGRAGTITPQDKDSLELRRSSIQVVELREHDGWLTANRDEPTELRLAAPPALQVPTARVGIHDPVMARDGGRYYLFATGMGIAVWSSADLKTWTREKAVFSEPPAWAVEAVPTFKGHIWAPDIVHHQGRYYLYYSVSAFGKNTSCIGVASNVTLDPTDPRFRWTDHGKVIQSIPGVTNWNAIDPAVAFDRDGRPYMAFGSFWDGLKLARLTPDLITVADDPATLPTIASRKADPSAPNPAAPTGNPVDAGGNAIEAPFIFERDGEYYLFASIDYCCRGPKSDYKMIVGRSKKVSGPYVDRDGKRLDRGGGTLLLEGDKHWYGLGHCSVYRFDETDYLVFHAYDAADEGRSKLRIETLTWDETGWPSVEPNRKG